MPVIHDIPLHLKTGEVLRREGFGVRAKIRPEIRSLILELLSSVNESRLLQTAVAYEVYTIDGTDRQKLSLEGNLVPSGSLLSPLMPEARELVVAVCTIGPGLEKKVADYVSQGEALRALLLDGIGSAAVDSLTQEVCKFVADEVAPRGYQVSSPISPGMPGLPITEQWQLLQMVPAQEIGVSLTSLGVMVPRKSASMVIGVGAQLKRQTRAEVCAQCSLRDTCPYKITRS